MLGGAGTSGIQALQHGPAKMHLKTHDNTCFECVERAHKDYGGARLGHEKQLDHLDGISLVERERWQFALLRPNHACFGLALRLRVAAWTLARPKYLPSRFLWARCGGRSGVQKAAEIHYGFWEKLVSPLLLSSAPSNDGIWSIFLVHQRARYGWQPGTGATTWRQQNIWACADSAGGGGR